MCSLWFGRHNGSLSLKQSLCSGIESSWLYFVIHFVVLRVTLSGFEANKKANAFIHLFVHSQLGDSFICWFTYATNTYWTLIQCLAWIIGGEADIRAVCLLSGFIMWKAVSRGWRWGELWNGGSPPSLVSQSGSISHSFQHLEICWNCQYVEPTPDTLRLRLCGWSEQPGSTSCELHVIPVHSNM